jgi:hypothetical protein
MFTELNIEKISMEMIKTIRLDRKVHTGYAKNFLGPPP